VRETRLKKELEMNLFSIVYAGFIGIFAGWVHNMTRQRHFRFFGIDNLILIAGSVIFIFIFDRVASNLDPGYSGFSLWSGFLGFIGAFVVLWVSYLKPRNKKAHATVIYDRKIEVDPDITRPTIRRGDL
jgi:uncharacterized membrane protein YeaQ/YmgE (transglycosylase-associated protein family)